MPGSTSTSLPMRTSGPITWSGPWGSWCAKGRASSRSRRRSFRTGTGSVPSPTSPGRWWKRSSPWTRTAHPAGRCPTPYTRHPAAPQLHRVHLDDLEGGLDRCLRAFELMLYRDVIHGDLSPYNVLVWEDEITLIDFPQAVDPKKNRHAEPLLARDVERICDHFTRHGVALDARAIARDLWTAWTFADLVPEELRGLQVDPAG